MELIKDDFRIAAVLTTLPDTLAPAYSIGDRMRMTIASLQVFKAFPCRLVFSFTA